MELIFLWAPKSFPLWSAVYTVLLLSSFFGFFPFLKDVLGNGAWSIGSVRASGTEGSEFEPSFRHPFLCGGLWQDLVIPCVWDTTVIACRWGLQSHVSERAKMRLFGVGSQIQLWRDRLQFPPLWWSWTICGHGCWRNRVKVFLPLVSGLGPSKPTYPVATACDCPKRPILSTKMR